MRNWVGSFLVILVVLLSSNVYAADIRVKWNAFPGGGPGTTWENAFSDLNDAIDFAGAGDSIWVAAGSPYNPGNDSGHRFVMKNNLKLLGGFVGTETLAEQRNPLTNVTILTGEIGSAALTDNCHTVVWVPSGLNGADTLIDGFTITRGYNDNTSHGTGGGIYAAGRVTVRQCNIIYNYALVNGGGFYGDTGSEVTFRKM